MNFLAIDFETANRYYQHSACAVALVKINNRKIIKSEYYLINPRVREFTNTWIHHISKADVKSAPDFGELWGKIKSYFHGIEFIVAHSFGTDRSILYSCCKKYGIDIPKIPFTCTKELSKRYYNIYPTKLVNVCDHFGINLFPYHHHAMADATACAKIMLLSMKHFKKDKNPYLKYPDF